MRWRLLLALFFTTVAVGPATAQAGRPIGLQTDAVGSTTDDHGDLIWNLVGLLGLIGLIGLLPQHEEDSYHPSSFDE